MSNKERGAAQICVTLEDSVITVRHTSEDGPTLFEREAVEGDWDKIWNAIRNIGQPDDIPADLFVSPNAK